MDETRHENCFNNNFNLVHWSDFWNGSLFKTPVINKNLVYKKDFSKFRRANTSIKVSKNFIETKWRIKFTKVVTILKFLFLNKSHVYKATWMKLDNAHSALPRFQPNLLVSFAFFFQKDGHFKISYRCFKREKV